jgi:hypothetical protein
VFHTRCPRAEPICFEIVPGLEPLTAHPAQSAACHFKE